MSRLYGVGIRIILATLVVSSAICSVAASRGQGRPPRAAEDLGTASRTVGPFRLEERSGRTVTQDDLADRVAIAAFIFTRCPLSCPRISSVMQNLQGRLAGSEVQLVSFSVDPEHDTPGVLKSYAERFGASPDRWWFLTGSKPVIYGLIRESFQLGVIEAPAPVGPDEEPIIHSDRLALIDHGRVSGLFDSSDAQALDDLVVQARRRALPGWVARLPSVNAALNGLSACLLLAGWIMIRRFRRIEGPAPASASGPSGDIWSRPLVKGHVACMVAAVSTSTLFLGCYLCYHHWAGSMPFSQGGLLRAAYLSILLSHTILATASVPLILVSVRRGWRGDLARHASIASVTLPIWLYVAVTGVVIYLMLYHLPVFHNASPSDL